MSAFNCFALSGGECTCVDPHPILASRGGETVSAEVIGYYGRNVCRLAIVRGRVGGGMGGSTLLTAKEARTLAQALMAAADRMVDLDPAEGTR